MVFRQLILCFLIVMPMACGPDFQGRAPRNGKQGVPKDVVATPPDFELAPFTGIGRPEAVETLRRELVQELKPQSPKEVVYDLGPRIQSLSVDFLDGKGQRVLKDPAHIDIELNLGPASEGETKEPLRLKFSRGREPGQKELAPVTPLAPHNGSGFTLKISCPLEDECSRFHVLLKHESKFGVKSAAMVQVIKSAPQVDMESEGDETEESFQRDLESNPRLNKIVEAYRKKALKVEQTSFQVIAPEGTGLSHTHLELLDDQNGVLAEMDAHLRATEDFAQKVQVDQEPESIGELAGNDGANSLVIDLFLSQAQEAEPSVQPPSEEVKAPEASRGSEVPEPRKAPEVPEVDKPQETPKSTVDPKASEAPKTPKPTEVPETPEASQEPTPKSAPRRIRLKFDNEREGSWKPASAPVAVMDVLPQLVAHSPAPPTSQAPTAEMPETRNSNIQVPSASQYLVSGHSPYALLNYRTGGLPRAARSYLQFDQYQDHPKVLEMIKVWQGSKNQFCGGSSAANPNRKNLENFLIYGRPAPLVTVPVTNRLDVPADLLFISVWESSYLRSPQFPLEVTRASANSDASGPFQSITSYARNYLAQFSNVIGGHGLKLILDKPEGIFPERSLSRRDSRRKLWSATYIAGLWAVDYLDQYHWDSALFPFAYYSGNGVMNAGLRQAGKKEICESKPANERSSCERSVKATALKDIVQGRHGHIKVTLGDIERFKMGACRHREYAFAFLALREISKNPKQYGFEMETNEQYFSNLDVSDFPYLQEELPAVFSSGAQAKP